MEIPQKIEVLKETPDWIAVYKPCRLLVHKSRLFQEETNCSKLLQKQIGKYLHPIHRLDRPTSGVLLFGKSRQVAGKFSKLFISRSIRKTYMAVVRGHLMGSGMIDKPLRPIPEKAYRSALTRYFCEGTAEASWAAGRYAQSRYSLLRLEPMTGRFHQIRKHMAFIAHPIVGDIVYGDGPHNRAFREQLGVSSMLLTAKRLEFSDPLTGATIDLVAPWNDDWRKVLEKWGWPSDFENLMDVSSSLSSVNRT